MRRKDIVVSSDDKMKALFPLINKMRRENYQLTGRISLVDGKVYFETQEK